MVDLEAQEDKSMLAVSLCCEKMQNSLKLEMFTIYNVGESPTLTVESESKQIVYRLKFCPFCGVKFV